MSKISEIVDDYILNKNVAITGAPGNGVTSICLAFANELISRDKNVVYFSPIDNIEREFVKKNYPYAYGLCTFVISSFDTLWDYITEYDYMIDVLIIDPADI